MYFTIMESIAKGDMSCSVRPFSVVLIFLALRFWPVIASLHLLVNPLRAYVKGFNLKAKNLAELQRSELYQCDDDGQRNGGNSDVHAKC